MSDTELNRGVMTAHSPSQLQVCKDFAIDLVRTDLCHPHLCQFNINHTAWQQGGSWKG